MDAIVAWGLVQARNLRHWHERILARFLERHGWVVFYLEPQARFCSPKGDSCWLHLYEAGKKFKG